MPFVSRYDSPLGRILLAADGEGLTGLWFEGQKYYAAGLEAEHEERETPILRSAKAWLDAYFAGIVPKTEVPLHPSGTAFQLAVWSALREIPRGQTVTYGSLAEALTRQRGTPASPRAVGGAVGHNPISILIPCHRVLGAGGRLTGYAGGVEKKAALLKLEGAWQDSFR